MKTRMRPSRSKLCVAVVLLSLCLQACAQDTVQVAATRLAQVKLFAFGGVGRAGVTSKGELDYRLIFAQSAPEALTAFENIFETGTPEAKAYALTGLSKLSRDEFRKRSAAAEASTDDVRTMMGCIISHRTLRGVAEQLSRTSPTP